ncbi:MAG: T9SS type A sorting domain-containing protein [Candidatus Delongbacteria bacterium]|jgi:hypothetical protein|nr:T9SS type A sorting domain-containing protein [Candidatus Delongbacteria bacterium]
MSMFAPSFGTPQLIIIGQDSKVTFSHQGYITEDSIRVEIRKALNGFGNLQQVKKASNIFLDGSKSIIDISENFIAVDSSVISYELLSVSDETIIDANLINSELTLSKGTNTGISKIKIKATTSSETVIDSFDVMVYPTGANVIDFETGDLYDQWFHEGDADWFIDSDIIFNGTGSARSGVIENGDSLNAVTYTLLRTTFESSIDDTLAFAYKISSETLSDGFEILLDGSWIDFADHKCDGEVDWSFFEYPVKAGKHIIEWDYYKWGVNSSGMDAAWIDIVKIPGVITGIEQVNIPSKTELYGNYPNPFNGSTIIDYSLNISSEVKLSIFNIKGEFISELVNAKQNRGDHKVVFNAFNIDSGVYFYRLEVGQEIQTGKMIYLK